MENYHVKIENCKREINNLNIHNFKKYNKYFLLNLNSNNFLYNNYYYIFFH